MVSFPLKVFLFVAGGSAAALATAYVSGAFEPLAPQPSSGIASSPAATGGPTEGNTAPRQDKVALASPDSAPDVAPAPSEAVAPAAPLSLPDAQPAPVAAPSAPAQAEALAGPTFDILRVEGDGSVVMAGKAAAAATIEILRGDAVIGATTAGPDGDFAFVFETPLAAGDHQLLLKSTTPDGRTAVSTQTAILSIPQEKSGQVLAMVEQPGQASRILVAPEAMAPVGRSAATPTSDAASDTERPVSETPPSQVPAATGLPTPATASEASAETAATVSGETPDGQGAVGVAPRTPSDPSDPAALAATASSEFATLPETSLERPVPGSGQTEANADAGQAPSPIDRADATPLVEPSAIPGMIAPELDEPAPSPASTEMAALAPDEQKPAAMAPGVEPAIPAPSVALPTAAVFVDAVEIEGRKVFVAGAAAAGSRVRVYANEIFLGETVASPEQRFLIETERDLPVGDYIIRADALDADGSRVVARAAVPFEREPGESIAAVAAPATPVEAPVNQPATAGVAPAEPDSRVAVAAAEPAEMQASAGVDDRDLPSVGPAGILPEAPVIAATPPATVPATRPADIVQSDLPSAQEPEPDAIAAGAPTAQLPRSTGLDVGGDGTVAGAGASAPGDDEATIPESELALGDLTPDLSPEAPAALSPDTSGGTSLGSQAGDSETAASQTDPKRPSSPDSAKGASDEMRLDPALPSPETAGTALSGNETSASTKPAPSAPAAANSSASAPAGATGDLDSPPLAPSAPASPEPTTSAPTPTGTADGAPSPTNGQIAAASRSPVEDSTVQAPEPVANAAPQARSSAETAEATDPAPVSSGPESSELAEITPAGPVIAEANPPKEPTSPAPQPPAPGKPARTAPPELAAVEPTATEMQGATDTAPPTSGSQSLVESAPSPSIDDQSSAPPEASIEPSPGNAEPRPADTPAVAALTPPSSETAPVVLAPKLQRVDSAVIIRRGDSLWRISRRVYGRGVRYSTIYLANNDQIRDPDRIWPGQVFSVPEKTSEGEAADLTKIGDQATTRTR